ncbi:MAG: hypothetical protein KJ598_00670, partial [Nanoarchaeota archaeon]|nr:hypothetical protein [Nanoarchaeota archaeon]
LASLNEDSTVKKYQFTFIVVKSNSKIGYDIGIIRSFLVRQPTPKNLGNIREIAWRFRLSRPNFPDNSC